MERIDTKGLQSSRSNLYGVMALFITMKAFKVIENHMMITIFRIMTVTLYQVTGE